MQANLHRRQALERYVHLLLQWNRVHNLTAWKDADQITSQLAASLPLYTTLLGSKTGTTATRPQVLDVGTGGGIPGIPLAMAKPDYHLVLLDSRAKRVAFVRQAIATLGLGNATAQLVRIENYQGIATGFDFVVARAFGSIQRIIELTARLIKPDGSWLLERGEVRAQELAWCKDCHIHVSCYPLPRPAKGQILVLHKCL